MNNSHNSEQNNPDNPLENHSGNDFKSQSPSDYQQAPSNGIPPQSPNPYSNDYPPHPPMKNPVEAQLGSIRSFATASKVCGLISLIFGGVYLSAIGLILALVSRSKLKKLKANVSLDPEKNERVEKSVKLSLTLCIVVLVINAIAVFLVFTGFGGLFEPLDISSMMGAETATSTPSSTWG